MTSQALRSAALASAPATAPVAAAAGASAAVRVDAALAILRVVTGGVLAAHGGQKLFVHGLAGVAGTFGQMGIPLAGLTGPATAFVEFFGGLALVVGLLTRLAGIGLALTMLGAMLLVHAAGGFFLPSGVEYTLALLGATVAIALAGPGRFSLDALLAARRGR